MSEQIQLIIRLSDDGSVYATSPQAPGLMYGRASLEELRSNLEDVLSFYFGRPGPFDVIEHHERHYDVADRELVTRLAMDEHRDERQAVYERIGQVLRVPGQAESLVSAVTNKVGETVYVCAVPSDRLGWLAAQLDGSGDALVAALTIADQFLLTLPIASDDGTHPAWSQGSSAPETELSEILQKIPVVTPPEIAPLEVVWTETASLSGLLDDFSPHESGQVELSGGLSDSGRYDPRGPLSRARIERTPWREGAGKDAQ